MVIKQRNISFDSEDFFQHIYAPKLSPSPTIQNPKLTSAGYSGNRFQVILASTGACLQ